MKGDVVPRRERCIWYGAKLTAYHIDELKYALGS